MPIRPAIKEYLLLDMNAVIRTLIMSDVIMIGANGLLGPIFSLYIIGFIKGADVAVVGTAASIYLITKSLLQVPIASVIDKIRGEMDDYWVLVIGSVISASIPLLYLVIHTVGQLYLVQFLLGVAMASIFPPYMAIFTRHIDRDREGTEWGAYFTLVDLSSAIFASIGGVVAKFVGYPALIMMLSSVGLIGALSLVPIRQYMKK